jgi:hypothetical protein
VFAEVVDGTPASSTTNTGRHDIAEILLKVALNTKNPKINFITKKQPLSLTRTRTWTFSYFSSYTQVHSGSLILLFPLSIYLSFRFYTRVARVALHMEWLFFGDKVDFWIFGV